MIFSPATLIFKNGLTQIGIPFIDYHLFHVSSANLEPQSSTGDHVLQVLLGREVLKPAEFSFKGRYSSLHMPTLLLRKDDFTRFK